MYIGKPQPSRSTTSIGDVMMFLVFVVFPVGVGVIILYRHLRHFVRSFKHQPQTNYAKRPSWMRPDTFPANREFEENGFLIHRKVFQKQVWMDKKGKTKEKDKLVIVMMRRMLERILAIEIQCKHLPDTTSVISIPKRSFKSSTTPGEFKLKVGTRLYGHFEYQMIGDDRIQVAYYIVGGVKYVAGVCIYIRDPYQSIIHYRESIVKKYLNKPEYWPTDCLEEETVEIFKRKNSNKQMLQTKNRYGEKKQWILNGDSKSFKLIKPQNESNYIVEDGSNLRILSQSFSVKLCHSEKKMVMISIREGERMHVEWCRNTRCVRYSKCATCDEPDDVPPPSYHSIKQKES